MLCISEWIKSLALFVFCIGLVLFSLHQFDHFTLPGTNMLVLEGQTVFRFALGLRWVLHWVMQMFFVYSSCVGSSFRWLLALVIKIM